MDLLTFAFLITNSSSTEMTAAAAESGGMTAMARVERLNHVLLCLEEIRASGGGSWRWSSGASTASNGGRSSSSVSSSPTTRLRSMEEAIVETRVNGSLIDRITGLESRLLKLEEEMEAERKREGTEASLRPPPNNSSGKKEMKKQQQQHKKSFKSIVKTCVRGQLNTKD